MRLSPDDMVFWQWGVVKINGTLVFTWMLMIAMTIAARLITRGLTLSLARSRWQNGLEPSYTRGVFHALSRYGLREATIFDQLAGRLTPVHLELLRRNSRSVFYEPLAGWDSDGNLIPVLAAEIPSKDNDGLKEDGLPVPKATSIADYVEA